MLISYQSVRIVFIFMANELALVAQRIRPYLVEGVVESKKKWHWCVRCDAECRSKKVTVLVHAEKFEVSPF